MKTLYTLLWWLLLPLIILLRWQKDRHTPLAHRFKERFGIYPSTLQPKGILIHAVSLGEIRAAIPLIEQLIQRYPHLPLTVTTTTATGSKQVIQSFGTRVQHVLLPLDFPYFIRRCLQQLQPKIILIMETELWPHLLEESQKHNIPVWIINARLSAKSFRRYHFLKKTFKTLMTHTQIWAQSDIDLQRFTQLAFSPHNHLMGNLKYDFQPSSKQLKQAQLWQHFFSAPLTWLVASTHQGEEELILDTFKALQQQYPALQLILAPRHPERFDTVAALIQQYHLSLTRRSIFQDFPPTATTLHTQIFLVDSIGELLSFYPHATVVTMGGSFVPTGGHNFLEAAYFAKPIVTGTFMHHFTAMHELFLTQNAIVSASSATLQTVMQHLLNSETDRIQLGTLAHQIYLSQQGALAHLLTHLAPVLNRAGDNITT